MFFKYTLFYLGKLINFYYFKYFSQVYFLNIKKKNFFSFLAILLFIKNWTNWGIEQNKLFFFNYFKKKYLSFFYKNLIKIKKFFFFFLFQVNNWNYLERLKKININFFFYKKFLFKWFFFFFKYDYTHIINKYRVIFSGFSRSLFFTCYLNYFICFRRRRQYTLFYNFSLKYVAKLYFLGRNVSSFIFIHILVSLLLKRIHIYMKMFYFLIINKSFHHWFYNLIHFFLEPINEIFSHPFLFKFIGDVGFSFFILKEEEGYSIIQKEIVLNRLKLQFLNIKEDLYLEIEFLVKQKKNISNSFFIFFNYLWYLFFFSFFCNYYSKKKKINFFYKRYIGNIILYIEKIIFLKNLLFKQKMNKKYRYLRRHVQKRLISNTRVRIWV